jgi:hypothetical protein
MVHIIQNQIAPLFWMCVGSKQSTHYTYICNSTACFEWIRLCCCLNVNSGAEDRSNLQGLSENLLKTGLYGIRNEQFQYFNTVYFKKTNRIVI